MVIRSGLRPALLLALCLPAPTLGTTEEEAVVLSRQGTRLMPFFEGYVSAKARASSPGKAVIASTAYVGTLASKPVVGLAGALIDTPFRGQALLDEAVLRYAMGQYGEASRTLNHLPNEFRQANAPAVDALRIRLALRGALDLPTDKALQMQFPGEDAAAGLFNQVLLLLKRQRADLALQRLENVVSSRVYGAPIRDRARLWAVTIQSETPGTRPSGMARDSQAGSVPMELPDLAADHPLAVEWLLATLRTRTELTPERAAAVSNGIARRMPNALVAFEARERLAGALHRSGATAQALAMTQSWIEELFRRIEDVDKRTRRADLASIQEIERQAGSLGETARERIRVLVLRRTEILKTLRLIDAWRPQLERLDAALRTDRKGLTADILQRASQGNESDPSGRQQILRQRMFDLFGEPPSREMSFRLFFGLTAWELGYEFPEYWRPELDAAQSTSPGDAEEARRTRRQAGGPSRRELLSQALVHSKTLNERLESRLAGERVLGFAGIPERLAGLLKRGKDDAARLQALLPEIDQAIRAEFRSGLVAERKAIQQWMLRVANQAEAALRLARPGREQPRHDLDQSISFDKSAPSLARQLAAIASQPRQRSGTEPDVTLPLAVTLDLAKRGDTREIRANALRVRARILLAASSGEKSARQDEVIAHLNELIDLYRDQIDPPEVIYQLAYSYEVMQRKEATLETLRRLVRDYPRDRRAAEAQFRIGDILFSMGDHPQARSAFEAIVRRGESRFREQSEYMLAWSHFKLGEYQKALERFIGVIDRSQGASSNDPQASSRVQDAYRALNLSFASLGGIEMLVRYFPKNSERKYAQEVYSSLGRYYLDHRNISDATAVYRRLIDYFPNAETAPPLLADLVQGARRENLARLALELQEEYAASYSRKASYWRNATPAARSSIRQTMETYLPELAQAYHADAQQAKRPESWNRAIAYYTQLIDEFPESKRLPRTHLLRGEARNESGDLEAALADYDAAAYRFGTHPDAIEAGYAGLVANQAWAAAGATPEVRRERLRLLVGRSSRFAAAFPTDARTGLVLVKAAEDILALGDAAEAVRLASMLLDPPAVATGGASPVDSAQKRRATVVLAHGLFESNRFAEAEPRYVAALALGGHAAATTGPLRERLALSIYRQGEALRTAGDTARAIEAFRRVGRSVPEADLVPNAEIDAAALLLASKQWGTAITVLDGFMKKYATHPLAEGVPLRLAHAYENDGQWLKAADAFESLSQSGKDPDLNRQMQYRSAELRERGGRPELALATWERYLKRFPTPLETASEVRQILADAAGKAGQAEVRDRWLRELYDEARRPGVDATPRTRFLAGTAALAFGDTAARDFDAIRLALPLDKALAQKRRAMEGALKWYLAAGNLAVAEVTTPATYKTAELNRRLARDILASERPRGLSTLETEQYKLLLEDEAQPFDDKAIALHEINFGRIRSGIYDDWVKRSMIALRSLNPGLYDKVERPEEVFEYAPPPPPAPPPTKASAPPPVTAGTPAAVTAPAAGALATSQSAAAGPTSAPGGSNAPR